MKLFKLLPCLLIALLFSCSTDEPGIDEFIGKWELSRVFTEQCDEFNLDQNAQKGGCIIFDGSLCITAEIYDDGTAVMNQEYSDDVEGDIIDLSYSYNENNHSLSLCGEGECNTATIVEKRLLFQGIEDGCIINFEMQKI